MSLLKYSLSLYVFVEQNQNFFQSPPWFFLTHPIIPIPTFVFGTQEDILMFIICDSFLYWFDCRKWPHKIEVSDFFFLLINRDLSVQTARNHKATRRWGNVCWWGCLHNIWGKMVHSLLRNFKYKKKKKENR